MPSIAVIPEPSIVPLPLAAPMAAISAAVAGPIRVEAKFAGAGSRSASACSTAAAVPSIAVRPDPLIAPLPFVASIAAICSAVACPVSATSASIPPGNSDSACAASAAVPLKDTLPDGLMAPLPLTASTARTSATVAPGGSVTSKFIGTIAKSSRA